MGVADTRVFTLEQTITKIKEVSEQKGEAFTLKLHRRTNLASTLNVIAVFGDAKVLHFVSPELWVPELAGGGKFQIQAYHSSDLNTPVGSFLSFSVDNQDARDVDMTAWKKPTWVGPLDMQFPKERPLHAVPDGTMYGAQVPPPAGTGSQGDSATNHAWGRPSGGGLHRVRYDEDPMGGQFGPLGARAGAIENERRKLEAEKLEAEKERHRQELRDAEKRHDAELKALEAKFEMKFATISAKPTGPDPSQMLIAELMKQQAEDRRIAEQRRQDDAKAQLEREERREKECKEDLRLERERQDRIDAREKDRQERLERLAAEDRKLERERYEKLLADRKDPLDVFKQAAEIIGKKNDFGEQTKALSNVMEMQSNVMGTAMDFVQAASNISLGGSSDQDPPWIKGLDKLVKGFGKMAFMRQPQLPQPPAQPPAQAPARGQGQPQQQQPQQQPANPQTILEQVEAAIREYHPVDRVAAALIHYYQDPSIQRALFEAGGDFEKAFLMRLGNWPNENAPKNQPYLQALFVELTKQAQAAGFMAPDGPEDEEEEDGADDEEAQVEEGDEGGEE